MNVTGRFAGLVRLLLALIVLLGTHLRVQMVARTEVIEPIRADARDYVLYALNLERFGIYARADMSKSGGGMPAPDAVRAPGYPAFLYAVFKALPDEFRLRGALWAQTALSVLAILLAFLLFRHFLPAGFALAATLLVAISPHLITANIYLLTETLYSVSLLVTLLAAARFAARPKPSAAAATGLLSGLTALIRPTFLLFILPLALLMGTRGAGRRGLACFLAALMAHAAVAGAWSWRNQLATGRFWDSTLQVASLHHGMYPGFMYNNEPHTFGFPYRYDPRSPVIAQDEKSVWEEIGRRFREDFRAHAHWYLIGKPISFWSWDYVQGMGDVFIYEVSTSPYHHDSLFRLTHSAMHNLHWPLVTLGILGALWAWMPRRFLLPTEGRGLFVARACSLLLVYHMIVHMVFASFPRYATPLRPVLFALGMFAVFQMAGRLRRGLRRHPANAGTI